MNEKDVERGINGIIDFIVMVWNNLFIPLVEGLGALFQMLPPIALGIIAGVIAVVWIYRKAKHG